MKAGPTKPGKESLEALLALPDEEAERIVREMGDGAALRFLVDWPAWVHAGQEPPEGEDWQVCLMFGGRGFGKTRAGAEWVSQLARDHPGAAIALVAANLDEARRIMVEGPSGLLAVARPGAEADNLIWEPSLRRLEFASGAVASLYSGAHADSLRGPELHFAWCDELAKWRQAQKAWDNLMLGLRAGDHPRALVTTTPRPIAALRAIIGGEGAVRAGGPTDANPHLAASWQAAMRRRYEGTRFGRQELDGEMFEDLEGALWTRDSIEKCRVDGDGHFARDGGEGDSHFRHDGGPSGPSARESDCLRARESGCPLLTVVGVDPPASVEGTCGIVVCGTDEEGIGYVLADLSVGGLAPEGWARKVAAAAEAWGAQRVVAEANNGGTMVAAVLRGANVAAPVRLVHAAEGKVARAGPVATLFESGRAKLAGRFPALEDELCGLSWDGKYHPGSGSGAGGPGTSGSHRSAASRGSTSPDRADAMVWALTELMLGRPRAAPRIQMV